MNGGSNDIWVIRPHAGVGPLSLGMTRAACVAALGAHETFRKSPGDPGPTLDFLDPHVHALLDAAGRVALLRVFEPQAVEFAGLRPFGAAAAELRGSLAGRGLSPLACDVGVELPDLGLVFVEGERGIECVEIAGP